MDFTVLIDLHGIPGSQNGWEESGLVGAIAYPDNTTNEERTLSVLKNLTAEFSQPYYNGVVTSKCLLCSGRVQRVDIRRHRDCQRAHFCIPAVDHPL